MYHYGGLHHKDHSIFGSILDLGFWVWSLEFGSKLLKGGYIGTELNRAPIMRLMKGDARNLGYSSFGLNIT